MPPALKIQVDKDNQLKVKKQGERNYQKIPGSFSIDEQNRLVYSVRDSSLHLPPRYGLRKKIIFTGNWSLDSDHQLVLKLKKSRHFQSQYLHLQGRLLKAGADHLLFEIKSRVQEGLLQIRVLKLRGFWKSDAFNRLIFEVKRKRQPEILILRNAWRLNSNHQIEYIYEQKKTKDKNVLVFKGFWEIASRNKLVYILEGSRSVLDFKASLESLNIYPQKGKLKYRIGVGLKSQREVRILVFNGEFKIGRNQQLHFEIHYDRKIKKINFNYTLKKGNNNWILKLSTHQGEPLGVFITYQKNPWGRKNYSYFATLGRKRRLEVKAGAKIKF